MSEIAFRSDTKHRKGWFTGMSFSHPAKMVLPLQLWLIENFTLEGETILDPMAGSGTILVACSMGRNVITCELEQKFVDMQKGNWQKIQERGPMMGYKMGTATILQGDARNLSGLADKIITSPPYSTAGVKGDENPANYIRREEERLKQFPNRPKTFVGRYGEGWDNIGNLPYGSIDKVITSPPYEASVSDNKESPNAGGNKERFGRWKDGTARKVSYTQDERVDSIITSPPYEGQMDGGSRHTKGGIPGRDNKMKSLGSYETDNDNNIGNLKSDSYLEAMRQVYSECHKVLKDGGLMCLVLKNFIRNKAIVRLDLDTIKLCELVGFSLKERHERRLTNQSFWRTIYKQKYPDAPEINQEDILVFERV